MHLLFYAEFSMLDVLSDECIQSPETFLLDLEDMLDRGEITPDEAIQMIRDFNR